MSWSAFTETTCGTWLSGAGQAGFEVSDEWFCFVNLDGEPRFAPMRPERVYRIGRRWPGRGPGRRGAAATGRSWRFLPARGDGADSRDAGRRVRALRCPAVGAGVELGEGSAGNWLTLAMRNGHGQTTAVAALFVTAFAAAEALTRIFGGPIVDHLGRVSTIRVTTTLGVLGVVLFILAQNRWIVLAGVLLWAVGVSMGFPLGMSAAAESGPDPAARVSVVASIGYFANLAGPPAIGVLAQSEGLLNALWLIVALFLAAFAAAGSLRPRPDAAERVGAPRPGTRYPAGS